MDSDFKKRERLCNLKSPRYRNDKGYPLFEPERELSRFMLRYRGKNPAWDYIQYLIKNKLI